MPLLREEKEGEITKLEGGEIFEHL